MKFPASMELPGKSGNSAQYVLKLRKPLCGLKQARLNWHNMLQAALLDRGFVESVSDACVYITKELIVLVYVDDCILISKNEPAITDFV